MKTSNPYLLAEIDSIEELFGRDANELEVVKCIDKLQLENEQLTQDRAELANIIKALIEYRGILTSGNELVIAAKEALEKHKC